MKLYAGFDGGGSKTACCLADENGKLLGVGLGGPLQLPVLRQKTAAQSVQDALNRAFDAANLSTQPLPPHRVWVCATHTHSAPRGAFSGGVSQDDGYISFLIKQCSAAAMRATCPMKP